MLRYSLGPSEDLAAVVLCKVAFRDLVEMFEVTASFTAKARPDCVELQKKIGELAKDLNSLNTERNIVVHSDYGELPMISKKGDGEIQAQVTCFGRNSSEDWSML